MKIIFIILSNPPATFVRYLPTYWYPLSNKIRWRIESWYLIPLRGFADEQVSVLRSFGFTIPKEMEETLGAYMEEYEVASYVETYMVKKGW